MDNVAAWFDRHSVPAVSVLLTIIIAAGASVLILFVQRLLKSWLKRLEVRLRLRYETVLTITRVVSGVLWLIVLMLVLEIWGIGVGGFWTVLVSLATVIGVGFLATWAMVSNMTASMFIAIWRPFRLGDTVELIPENIKGRVIDITLMFVVLREESGAVVQIPNNLFFQKMFRVRGNADRSLFEVLESGSDATGLPP
jgi:small-conductance mechanosensitive channel